MDPPNSQVYVSQAQPQSEVGSTNGSSIGEFGLGDMINEVIARILLYINPDERQRLRATSIKFRNVIDEIYGMKVRIKNSTSDLVMNCPWAKEVELNSMTKPFDSISFSQSIRKLVFSNIVVTYNLVSFLRECGDSITHLSFINIILDLPVNDPWSQVLPETIQLKQLDTLEIKCFTFADGVVDILNFVNEKITFFKIKNVVVNVQNPPVIPYQVLFQQRLPIMPPGVSPHPLIGLLRKLRPTLRKFMIGRPNMPTVLQFYPPSQPQEPEGVEDEQNVIGVESPPPQLEQLEIHPYFREEWTPLLHGQLSLRIMKLGSCNVGRWPEIVDAVTSNSRTLESFTIGGLSFGQIWDCAIFQNCFNLKDLAIEISHSNKVNFSLLPQHLKALSVFGPVQLSEIVGVAESLVGLESIKFTHLGRIAEFNNAEEDKITLEVFKSLLQLPNLKSLVFATCSTISIDWDIISLWCATVEGTPGFNYTEKYFQTHGEFFRNGITVQLSEEFKRDSFDWALVPPLPALLSPTPSLDETSSNDSSPGGGNMPLSEDPSDDSVMIPGTPMTTD